MSRISPINMILVGLILAGFPFLAIASHLYIGDQGERFEIPSHLSTISGQNHINIHSEINQLSLHDLSGTDKVKKGDIVYIHMTNGPELIAYPFAITHSKPTIKSDNHTFSIRGVITDIQDDKLNLRYNFETILSPKNIRHFLDGPTPVPAKIELAVNQNSIARIMAIKIDGTRYPYRVMERPELKGLMQ